MEYNELMIWLRRSLVGFLSLMLFVSLLGGALAASARLNLTHPAKIEAWLAQSLLYDHFVNTVIDEADKSKGDDQSGSVSLNDAAVQQAAKSAFSPQLLQGNVNTFLESNYAWMEGKTATPNFKIDLTAAKQSFAQQVGQYVRVYTAGLPVCTAAQLAALQNQQPDPLAATCRPPATTPEAAGAAVTQKLSSSGDFLSNPVITAETINPDAHGQPPYYKKLSRLPDAYQLALKLPLIFSAMALISMLGIVYIAPRKRAGIRRIAILLTVSGIILVALKFAADFGFHRVEQRVFNTANNGELQHSLTDFAHRVESALVKIDLLFGAAFIVLALAGFVLLYRTRQQDTSAKDALTQTDGPLSALPKPEAQNPGSSTPAPAPKPKKPRPPQRPRLIQ